MDTTNHDENSDDDTEDEILPVFGSPPVWRRDQAIPIIVSASELLKCKLPEDQQAYVTQILFSAMRIYLEAQDDIRPGCLTVFLPFRTPLHRRELLAYVDEASELVDQLVEDPDRAVSILEEKDRVYRVSRRKGR
jgi:hypothetical protein